MKLILENWRRYINEEELAATAPRVGKRIERGRTEEPIPVKKLLPTFFKVLQDDPETFDTVQEKIAGKTFEEIKEEDPKFIKDMEEEINDLIEGFSRLQFTKNYLRDGIDRKNFLKFVNRLPDEKKEAVLKAVGVMSNKYSRDPTFSLMGAAPNEIRVYSCLFKTEGVNAENITDEQFAKCRKETEVPIEEDLDK
jgi:hypothetical protein